MKAYELKREEDTVVEIYMPEPKFVPNACLDYDSGHACHWTVAYSVRSKARAILNAAQGIAVFTRWDIEDEGRRRRSFFSFEFKTRYDKDSFMYLVEAYL
ncbi:MAG: hypothetical protein IKE91_06985 [Clostridia bacterium]|nr:hypothetical protein [Clostridia bacterium]